MVLELAMDDPDIAAIEKTISFFVKRHESVRTIFPLIDGEIKQMVLPYDEKRFELEFIDTTKIPESYATIKEEYLKRTQIIFADKQTGPLVNFLLFKLDENKHAFFLLIDHIICDGWSLERVIREELAIFYQSFKAGSEPNIKPLKAQLRDYCDQQNTWLVENREELSSFWKNKLFGYDTPFNINNFHQGYSLRNKGLPDERTIERAKTQKELCTIYDCPQAFLYTVTISGQRFNRIKELAELNKCTISSIVYASLYISLYCYTGKSRILLAAFIADRFTPANQLIIGYLIGAAYFPREISDDFIVRDFIDETFHDILTGCQNIIISDLYLDLDSTTLRTSCDVLVNYIRQTSTLPPLTEILEQHIDTPGIYYPLEYAVFEYEDGLAFYWRYNKLLFDKELLEDLAGFHKNTLDFMTRNSDSTIGELSSSFKAKMV